VGLISVIVPIYNCEKYVSRCIESIINQEHKELEILLINDGSTDSSKSICEKYALQDTRIHLINKENSGVSASRNIGLSIAKGDYIAFVDADDYIDPEMYSSLYLKAIEESADMVFCRIKRFDDSGQFFYPDEKNLYRIKNRDIEPLFYTTKYSNYITKVEGVVWRTLYNKKFIENEFFDENLKYGEDLLFISSLILKSQKISIVDEYYYNYFTNVNSACNLINERYFDNLKDFYLSSIEFLYKNNLNEIKYLVDYGYLVRVVQNRIRNKDFVKQIKQVNKTDTIFANCLNKESYRLITKHETKKSVKIINFLIFHKCWKILKMLTKLR